MSGRGDEGSLVGIVVGTVDVGEAHRIVRLLTAERGRVAIMARGARASSKRFAGLLEVGTSLEVSIGRGRGGLPLLKAADRLGGPKRARRDLDRLALLAYGCELCDALCAEDEPAPKLHGLLAHWNELLEEDAQPGPSARLALEAKALTFAGLAPALVRCARCGGALEDPAVYDALGGGGRHGRCGGGIPCRAEDLAELERLRRTPLRQVVAEGQGSGSGPLQWALARTVEAHIGRGLRSLGLLVDLAVPRG